MRKKLTAGLLAIFFGSLGVHKFYLGKPILGVLYLVFCVTFIPAILGIIEGIIYLATSKEVFDKQYNSGLLPQTESPAIAKNKNTPNKLEEEQLEKKLLQQSKAQLLTHEKHQNEDPEKRKLRLIDKYGEEIGTKLFEQQYWIGMEKKLLLDSKGAPSLMTTMDKNTTIEKLYFDRYTNESNATAYRFEVEIKDGLVVGWKEL